MRLLLLPVPEQLSSNFPSKGVDLATEEGLREAVSPRDEPKDSVDEIDPHSSLLDDGAAALVRIVGVAVEKNACKDSKRNDPENEDRQVPGEQPMCLTPVRDGAKGRGNGKSHRSDGRDARDDKAIDPFWGQPLGHPVSVDSDDDDAQEELESSDDHAGDALPCPQGGGGHLLSVADAVVCLSLCVRPGVEAIFEDGVFIFQKDGEELGDSHY